MNQLDNPINISVIIPFFNRSEYLNKAIDSVLKQSYQHWELILVDDGSSDDSLTVAQSYIDNRIKVLSYRDNRGNAYSRNVGWKNTKFEWVAYLDSDDEYEKNYLLLLTKGIQSYPQFLFFWTGVNFVNQRGETIKKEFWSPKLSLPGDTFFDELRIGTNTGICFHKKIFKNFGGFNENFRASVDREFLLRISPKVKGRLLDFVGVNCLLSSHDSVRKDYYLQARAYWAMFYQFYDQICKSKQRHSKWLYKIFWLQLYAGNRELAFLCFKKLIFNHKAWILYILFWILPTPIAIFIHKKLAK